MDAPDSSKTVFWTKRWEAGKTPWDLGGVPPALAEYLHRTHTATTAFIPGCGTGYEVRTFHEVGYDVVALDFSAPAVAHAREVLGSLGDRVIHGNFFKHDLGKQFGVVYERGFLCSLPPERWPDYAARMADLISSGGKLIGLFLYGEEPEPPPFPLTKEIAATLFARNFRLVHDQPVMDGSVPVYQGLEHWQEWERV